MTSPSPARSKTTPLSGKLSAGHIVKKYQRLRKTGLLYLGFIFLELQLLDGLPLPLTLLVRAILLLRTSFTMLQSEIQKKGDWKRPPTPFVKGLSPVKHSV